MKKSERRAKDRKALRMTVLITQIGICMMVPIFFCVFLGQRLSIWLDQPVVFPLLLLIGVLAGFRSSYEMIKRFTGISFHNTPDPGRRETDQTDQDPAQSAGGGWDREAIRSTGGGRNGDSPGSACETLDKMSEK